jgi:hypothetical protein
MKAEDEARPAETGCCGGAPSADQSACCKKDEDAKAAGEAGCGCGSRPTDAQPALASACCA